MADFLRSLNFTFSWYLHEDSENFRLWFYSPLCPRVKIWQTNRVVRDVRLKDRKT